MLTFLMMLTAPADAANLISSTEITGGYECVYREPAYIDEEGYEHPAGPPFKMLSTTPCPKTITVNGIVHDLDSQTKVRALRSDIQLGVDDVVPGGGIDAMVNICVDLHYTTLCYEAEYPSCYEYRNEHGDENGNLPTGTTCDNLQ